MATVRRDTIIQRSASDVWDVVGDPATIHQWFPGMVDCTVEGKSRIITTRTGLPLPEEILTIDNSIRRFQYRVLLPVITHHRGTIDVFDIGENRSLVSYATDCEPDAMALIIGGATGAALEELRSQLESSKEN